MKQIILQKNFHFASLVQQVIGVLSSIASVGLKSRFIVALCACVATLPFNFASAGGLLWNEADLDIWRNRAENGPYKTAGDNFDPNTPAEWQRIVANKDKFASNPAADRKSSYTIYTSNNHGSTEQLVLNHMTMVDAAFYSLVKADSSLATKVKNELMWHANNTNLQINPTTYIKTDNGNWWKAEWFRRILFSADYVKHVFTATELKSFNNWIEDWAYAFEYSIQRETGGAVWGNRYERDYVNNLGWAAQKPYFNEHAYMDANGKLFHPLSHQNRWNNNRRASVFGFYSLASVWLNDPVLIDRSKLFVEEQLKFWVYPDGAFAEFHRNGESGRSVSVGLGYATINLSMAVTFASALADNGDPSMINYSTRDGVHGSESTGGEPAKSLQMAVVSLLDLIEHEKDWYAHTASSPTEDNRIHSFGENGKQWILDVAVAPIGNRHWKNERIREGYMRLRTGSPAYPDTPSNVYPAGPNGPHWRGVHGEFPSVLFMYAENPPGSEDSSESTESDAPQSEPDAAPVDSEHEATPGAEVNYPEGYREATVSGQTVFGLDPAWKSGSEFEAAFDGRTDTFFDYNNSTETFIGLDAGEAKLINSVTFHPRIGKESRMVGVLVQGSNESSVSGYVTLHEITEAPRSEMQTIQLNPTERYRYYRLFFMERTHGNVSELAFDFDNSQTDIDTPGAEEDPEGDSPVEDADRLPDDWQEQYFGGTSVANSSESDDFDGDGISNYDEWLAGTDPADANDRLSIEPVLGVSWKSRQDRSYRIEYSDDNWRSSSASEILPGNGGQMVWIDDSARDVRHNRQYRINVVSN